MLCYKGICKCQLRAYVNEPAAYALLKLGERDTPELRLAVAWTGLGNGSRDGHNKLCDVGLNHCGDANVERFKPAHEFGDLALKVHNQFDAPHEYLLHLRLPKS